MKPIAILSILSLLAGCQPDAETRAFFYSGWVHPEQGANERMNGGASQPVPVER